MAQDAGAVQTRCGYIAILGRPNVGKSTLLNRILGQKISITSRKPQTTRHRILGIKTTAEAQAIYVDTPGIHKQAKRALNRYMNRAALAVVRDVDVIILIVAGTALTEEDRLVIERLPPTAAPLILAVNKVDNIADKNRLLPLLEELGGAAEFAHIVPISARTGENVERLERLVDALLPPGPFLFPSDQVTDRSERFLAAELVREKLMRRLGDELPYSLTVEIEEFSDRNGITHITAIIWVEGAGQRRIVIGHEGRVLKDAGRQARLDMEQMLGRKVFLQLWVKVKEGWADSERSLQALGYDEQQG